MTHERTPATDPKLQLPFPPPLDAPDAYAAFGLANTFHEVVSMLRLRFSDESWKAFPYYSLGAMSYDAALGIELNFHTTQVRIRGRNLLALFTFLGDHNVRWCWEANRSACLQTLESEPLIEQIELGPPKTYASTSR